MRARLQKLFRSLRWRSGLYLDLLRGPEKRHRTHACWAGMRLVRQWRRRVRQLHRQQPGREVIAIAMVEHLGDVVAAEPVSRHVRQTHPDAYIVWAVQEKYRALIDNNPHIDETLPVQCLTEWIYLSRPQVFDRVFDLQVEDRDCPICRVQVRKPAGDRSIHIRNYYEHGNLLQIDCRCGGLPVLNESPRVYIPSTSVAAVDALNLPRPFVVLHGRSNQEVRDWQDGKWRTLAQQLIALGMTVVEVGLHPVVDLKGPGYLNLCGTLDLLMTAEVIRRSACFVGIDSGPAHLAHAAGAPGVILLGAYRRYQRYMPYSGSYGDGSMATVIQHEGPAADIAVATVLAAVQGRLGGPSPRKV